MPMYEYECETCGFRFEQIRNFPIPHRVVPELRRTQGPETGIEPGHSVQGIRVVRQRLRQEGRGGDRREGAGVETNRQRNRRVVPPTRAAPHRATLARARPQVRRARPTLSVGGLFVQGLLISLEPVS